MTKDDIVKKIQSIEDEDIKKKAISSFEQVCGQIKALDTHHPYVKEEQEYCQRNIENKLINENVVLENLEKFQTFNPKHNTDFIKKSLEDKEKDIKDLNKFVLKQWAKVLKEKKQDYKTMQSKAILEDFSRRIDLLIQESKEAQKLQKDLGGLFGDLKADLIENFDIDHLGDKEYQKKFLKKSQGYDKTNGIFNKTKTSDIRWYFENIKNNKALSEICELLGKLRTKEEEEEKNIIKEMKSYEITQSIPTKNSKEEISGVMLGRNLEELLPQEFGLFSDEDLENLFILKFLENRLFCFEKQAYVNDTKIYEIEEEVEKLEKTQKQSDKGAMIVCVDTSGSMQGKAEIIAKGISLFIAKKAKMEKRACYLINFSTDVKCIDLTSLKGFGALYDFLNLSFNGGTDVGIALKKGIEKMQDDEFKKSDLLVISDGGFGQISQDISQAMMDQRKQENKFYLLDINGRSISEEIFDKHWQYHTNSQSIEVIYELKKEIK